MNDHTDRPDLELERLVMGDEAREDRPAAGWVVREDVVRGAVERIKELAKRLDLSETEHKITEQALQGGAGMIVALKERNDQAREALARSEMEAAELRKQLEEEKRMVKRLRERIERAPKAKAFVRQDGGVQVFPPPWKSRSTGKHIRVAIVRLDDISLEPATTDGGKAVAPTNAERERDALRTELAETTEGADA